MNVTTSLNVVLELLYMCRVVTVKLCLIVSGICILEVNEILCHECSGTNFVFLEKAFLYIEELSDGNSSFVTSMQLLLRVS